MANNGDLVSNTLPYYRFKLINPETEQSIILRHEPIEWESGQIEFNRIIEVGGIFTNFIVKSLTFIKEGANFIRTIWNEKELNGQCNLEIAWFKQSTRQYINFPSTFSLNFATIKPFSKVGKNAIGLSIEAINSSELTKFYNRKKTKVDLTKRITNDEGEKKDISIGGVELISNESLKKNFNFPAFDIPVYAKWVDDLSSFKKIENNDNYIVYTNLQMSINSTSYQEAKSVNYATNIININSIGKFFEDALNDYTVDFTYSVLLEVTNRKGRFWPFLSAIDVYHLILEEIDSAGHIVNTNILHNFGRTTGVKVYNNTITATISAGNSLRFYIKTDKTDNVAADIRFSACSINYSIAGTDARKCEGLPIYEAIESSLQRIMDTQYPFYSEFFGRLDTSYNSSGSVYSSETENQLRFASLFSGLNLRGAALLDEEIPLAISFNDLYQSINSLYNIGYELELRDTPRIRIEEYGYFFDDTEVLDISDRISDYDIESEVMPELAFQNLKSGYEDFDYEAVSGRGEYNTSSERTSIINTDTEFDNISKIRADTKGITKNLGEILETNDTKSDNDLFIVKSRRDGLEWKPEFQEYIKVEGGSSIFGDQSLNLYYTPMRNLLRHGNKIKSSLIKFDSSKLRFQTSPKLQTLETTEEGYDYTVIENEDYLVDNLADPIYKPIAHTVECRFDYDDLAKITANPRGYINFGKVTGYLLNLKKKNNEDKATIKIIERY